MNEKLNKVKIMFCDMCFDRFRTILVQKSLKLSAMILVSLVLTLQMLETECYGLWISTMPADALAP